jgi:Fe-S cluster assembly protein SufD
MNTTDTQRSSGVEKIIDGVPEPHWMTEVRRKAVAAMQTMDWPDRRDEEWRRTDISYLDFDEYSLDPAEKIPVLQERRNDVAGYIEFHNGTVVATYLDPELAEKGVVLASLGDILTRPVGICAGSTGAGNANGPEPAEAFISHLAALFETAVDNLDNRIQAWHFAVASYGAVLYVPSDIEIDLSVEIRYLETGDKRVAPPQTALILETGAGAVVVNRILGQEDGEILYNESVNCSLADASRLTYTAVHALNRDSTVFSHGRADIGRDATLVHGVSHFGGMMTKGRFDARLNGAGADARLYGVYFGHEDQHIDLRTVQIHNADHATSNALYKGAASGEARTVYQGLIYVAEDAVRTDAYLTNNNLVLNDGARSDSIPCLQIHTNDVKCSHGSTTGKLDPLQIQYLQTRGLSRSEAEKVLIEGFFEDVLRHLPSSIQDDVRHYIAVRIED